MTISFPAFPMPLCPEKQVTNHFCVPPLGMPPAFWICAMVACSVPLNGDAVPFTIGAIKLVVVPSAWTSLKVAEPWNPLGHAPVVCQVGVLLVGPLAGFNPTAAVPVPWAALDAQALESAVPTPIATTPASHLVKRPF